MDTTAEWQNGEELADLKAWNAKLRAVVRGLVEELADLRAENTKLRALLRELVEDDWSCSDRDDICLHCYRDLDRHEHTDDCPVRRARAELE